MTNAQRFTFRLPVGSAISGCDSCGCTFSNPAAFEEHRVEVPGADRRRCLTNGEMTARGMLLGTRGRWITSSAARRFGYRVEYDEPGLLGRDSRGAIRGKRGGERREAAFDASGVVLPRIVPVE
jgi:hypothetical protein